MLQKISICDKSEFKHPVWLEDFGDHNNMPTPWREADVSEYIRARVYYPNLLDSRFITHDAIGSVTIEWFFDCGFAIRLPNKWHSEGGRVVFTEEFRYFRIGCDHDYSEQSPSMHRHIYTCKQCGFRTETDSSG